MRLFQLFYLLFYCIRSTNIWTTTEKLFAKRLIKSWTLMVQAKLISMILDKHTMPSNIQMWNLVRSKKMRFLLSSLTPLRITSVIWPEMLTAEMESLQCQNGLNTTTMFPCQSIMMNISNSWWTTPGTWMVRKSPRKAGVAKSEEAPSPQVLRVDLMADLKLIFNR